MTSFTAGIFGGQRDPHVQSLAAALAARGARSVVVDLRAYPSLHRLTAPDDGATPWAFDDVRQRDVVDLRDLDVVCLRTVHQDRLTEARAAPLDAAGWATHHRREVARAAAQISLLDRLARRIPVINPPQAFRWHRLKGAQHTRLLGADIPTPAALVTTDEAEARAFVARVGAAVVKPQASGAEVVLADDAFFAAHHPRFGRRPYLFQQRVGGRSLRAYLLGGRVVSAGELHHDRTHVDWRERTQGLTPGPLPPEVADQARRAVRLLDLPYCGIDIEWDASTRRYYFLDFNPSALFVHWGRMAGLDMALEIARYLERVAAQGDPWLGR